MKKRNKLNLIIQICILLIIFGNVVMACDPPDPGCTSNDECAACQYCDSPDCLCGITVTSIDGLAGDYYCYRGYTNITINLSGSLPEGCTADNLVWYGPYHITNVTVEDDEIGATVNFTTVGTDMYLGVKTSCQDDYVYTDNYFTVLATAMEVHPQGNNPELALGRICINAQDSYKKVKHTAYVHPGTAQITCQSGGVTFEGINGSDPDELNNCDQFWVCGGSSSGTYTIRLKPNVNPNACYSDSSEYVFEFKFDATKYNRSSSTSGNGTVNEVAGDIDAKNTSENGILDAGTIQWYYKMKVITAPYTGCYSGNVDAKAKISTESSGGMTIKNSDPPSNWSSPSLSINFAGFLYFNLPANNPAGNYYGAAAADADTKLEINNGNPQAAQEAGDVHHDFTEAAWPAFYQTYKSTYWGAWIPQTVTDITRTYVTGSTEIPFWTQIAAASNDDASGTPEVEQNAQHFFSMEITNANSYFEIKN